MIQKITCSPKSEFQTVTPKGKVSYRKAFNVYGFYNQLKAFGYKELKDQNIYSVRRFNELVADLCLCGFSKSLSAKSAC